jgi:hypothetical protein
MNNFKPETKSKPSGELHLTEEEIAEIEGRNPPRPKFVTTT